MFILLQCPKYPIIRHLSENMKGDSGVGGRIILKWLLKE
jgi:hypothetical protein